ncbi:MAG: type I glyceraldehyde-3-phosphate dehydrogenase, partial [Deltaproteobacteria bacterium]|nr:type I glyceraldehyde-3-phosphate dehydrogenase [Deltaproteobacteria bacterium]
MSVKVAINGFGRIGRFLVRTCLERDDIEIVAVNTRADTGTLAHLLKYDSVHGKIKSDVTVDGQFIVVGGRKIQITNTTGDMETLPWKELGVDIVMESTGKFRTRDEAAVHIKAGAKKVIIAAPGKGLDGTFVMGVNEETYDSKKHDVISNASCTTNCLAPVAMVLEDTFSIVK